MRHWKLVVGLILVSGAAAATAIKSWSSNEVLLSKDLNANFTHIHNTMVGGHGARLVNADVSASAAIAHSKLATPALVAKAWGWVTDGAGAGCNGAAAVDATTCTTSGSQVASVKSGGTAGVYRITLAYTPVDVNFAALINTEIGGSYCVIGTRQVAAPHLTVHCETFGAVVGNQPFSFVVLDQ